MVLPLAKRFHHHFMTRRATNRPNKPEWFFAFVLDAIRCAAAPACPLAAAYYSPPPARPSD